MTHQRYTKKKLEQRYVMKKEIPRMLRNASTVYAFDFFQTILTRNSTYIFDAEVLLNPYKLGIRWIIIANIPKIWYPIIKLVCILKGLNPNEIILSDNWFHVKDTENFILNILLNIINKKFVIKDINSDSIRRIRYISNDTKLIKFLNSNISKIENNILAESVTDFWSQKFDSII